METAIKQIRALTADTAPPYVLDDATLQTFLSLYDDGSGEYDRIAVFRAAADSLDAVAVSEALISKKIRTQDLSTDGPAVADSIRKTAAGLRARADEEEASLGGIFEIYSAGSGRNEGEEYKYGSVF